MPYRFIDRQGTFIIKDPSRYKLYFPLTDARGNLLSSVSPNLAGDIKKDNQHFLTPPASIEDLNSNLLCRREFFLKIEDKTLRLSYPHKDTLEVGLLYQKVTKRVKNLKIEVVNFIPYTLAAEVMWVKIKNCAQKSVKIIPTSFIPLYGRPERNLRDHRHVSSLLNRITLDKYGIYLNPAMVFDEKGHRIDKTIYYALGFQDKAKTMQGQFPTLDYFYGRGDILSPDAVEKNLKAVTKKRPYFDGKEACAAFRFPLRRLKPNAEVNYFLILGIAKKKPEIKNIFRKLNSSSKVKNIFAATRQYWQKQLSLLDLDFRNPDFNNWLIWVKMQLFLRKLFGCSFLPHFDYGKGGRGWRDLWQDTLSLLLIEPGKAKNFILKNFQGVRIDGSHATIITKDGNFIADRNQISRVWMDHGVWPYLTLRFYIEKSGDLNILLKATTYFADHLLKRAQEIDADFCQEDNLLRDKNKRVYQGTILEHILVETLVCFFNVGSHNISRLENADWNDGLDMARDKGESVTFSFMYAHNLRDLCGLLEKLKGKTKTVRVFKELTLLLDRLNIPLDYSRYRQKQERLAKYLEAVKNLSGEKTELSLKDLVGDLKAKAKHFSQWLREKEWQEVGYFNGYYDNRGRRVEGKINGKIRIFLPSQVFALLSGVASLQQARKTWQAIKKYLWDKKLGGFHLNTDLGRIYPDLGRAFAFAYGEKENGAFFNHMVVMLANALYKRGLVKEGFTVINSLYQMATDQRAEIGPLIPEYFNCQGLGLYHYLTGSASWYIYTLVEEVLGIKFSFGEIYLEPKLTPQNFFASSIKVKLNLEKRTLSVIFIRPKERKEVYQLKSLSLNGKKTSCPIKKEELELKENILKVYLG